MSTSFHKLAHRLLSLVHKLQAWRAGRKRVVEGIATELNPTPDGWDATPTGDRYASSEDEADVRFERFGAKDPFPKIAPALLNSADISDYVAATGMIFPFYEEKQKPASYEVALLGKCVYWDDKGEKHVEIVKRGEQFSLRQNSIAFVTLEPTFRIPDYIALRFNLKITHIYRGILLGTGPLVDPGFNGKLSVPLHNLTTNDYTFAGGEALIWMEFTKLSDCSLWESDELPRLREGTYQKFPPQKNEFRDIEDYLRKADQHRAIRSSIPDAIESARKQAERAANRLRAFTFAGAFGIVAVLVTLAFGSVQIAGLFNVANSHLRDSQKELQDLRSQLEAEKTRSAKLQADLNDLSSRIQAIERR